MEDLEEPGKEYMPEAYPEDGEMAAPTARAGVGAGEEQFETHAYGRSLVQLGEAARQLAEVTKMISAQCEGRDTLADLCEQEKATFEMGVRATSPPPLCIFISLDYWY